MARSSVRDNERARLEGHINRGDGLSRQTFFAARKSHLFCGRGLDADPVHGQAEDISHPFAHSLAVRLDLGPLADQRQIDIDDDAALGLNEVGGMTQEDFGRDTAPLRIGRGK